MKDPRDSFEHLRADLLRRFEGPLDVAWPGGDFERLALSAFAHQFGSNPIYRSFCEARRCTPATVRRWEDVPLVPTMAFKHLDLHTGGPGSAEVVFRTSGTTRGGELRGRHHVRSVALYRASLLPPFREFIMHDAERLPFISLIPAPTELPDSSLSFMVGAASEEFASETHWFVDGSGAIDRPGLMATLERLSSAGEPFLLLGTAFAFVHALEADALRCMAPEGSRIMETGGFKGRVRDIGKHDLYRRLTDSMGIPGGRIVNEYGMTELLSQLYEAVQKEGPAAAGTHVPPPWMRVLARDPTSLEVVPEGEKGILAFFDLANLGSACAIMTEDVGSVADGRVRLVGRAEGSEPRGCSRAMDDLMVAAR